MEDFDKMTHPSHIIFYDGFCGFCHWWVKFLLKIDSDHKFRFSPRGCEAADKILEPYNDQLKDVDSILLLCNDELHIYSDAVSQTLIELGSVWAIAGKTLRAIPKPIRDCGYKFVAKIRKSLASAPKDVCPTIAPEQLRFFIK